MSVVHAGSCHCNQIELYLKLPEPLANYSPRACDCDFCSDNDILFLSDPFASLEIVSTISLAHVRQGSKQAEFLSCLHCEQIVAAVAQIDGVTKGAINTDCLYDSDMLADATPVSSQTLSPRDRKARWANHWMSVTISEPD